jgi:threonine dehydrogenase-like Zn-dependent dehydrogenase
MTEASPVRAEGARKFGDAHQVFDALNPGLIGELLDVSDPGFDVCVECAGVGASIDTAIMALNPGAGVMVQVALNLEPVPVSLTWMVVKETKIRPVLGYFVRDFDTCLDMIARKEIDVERFVTRTCSFDGAQDAFMALTSGKSPDVKIVIKP